jgi:flagellar basal body-associated protein FliL
MSRYGKNYHYGGLKEEEEVVTVSPTAKKAGIGAILISVVIIILLIIVIVLAIMIYSKLNGYVNASKKYQTTATATQAAVQADIKKFMTKCPNGPMCATA